MTAIDRDNNGGFSQHFLSIEVVTSKTAFVEERSSRRSQNLVNSGHFSVHLMRLLIPSMILS